MYIHYHLKKVNILMTIKFSNVDVLKTLTFMLNIIPNRSI